MAAATQSRITTWSANPDVVVRVLHGVATLVHITNNQIFELNVTGARIWELATTGHRADAIADALTQEFDIDQQAARNETSALIAELNDAGLLIATS